MGIMVEKLTLSVLRSLTARNDPPLAFIDSRVQCTLFLVH